MLGLLAEVPSAVVLASAVRLALRLAVRLARVRLACVWNLTSANKYVTFSLPVARGCRTVSFLRPPAAGPSAVVLQNWVFRKEDKVHRQEGVPNRSRLANESSFVCLKIFEGY